MKLSWLSLACWSSFSLMLNAEVKLDRVKPLSEVGDTKADSYPALQDRYLLGLEKRIRSERAMLTSVSLGDRDLWRQRIKKTEQLIQAQKQLLGTYATKSDMPMPLALKNHRRPNWVPEGELNGSVLSMEDIAETPPWLPKWGQSAKQKRLDRIESSEKGLLISWPQSELMAEDGIHSEPPRRVAPPELPVQDALVPHAVLPRISEQTLAKENINLSVPMPFRRGAWWLWDSTDHTHWTKIRSGWADQNIAIGPLPEGQHYYMFTHEQRRPNDEPCHYSIRLDTTAPTITSMVQELDKDGLTQIRWSIEDREPHTLKSSLTIFGMNDTVVATLGKVNAIGDYTLLREQRRDALAIRLRTTDLAGNTNDAWIRYR